MIPVYSKKSKAQQAQDHSQLVSGPIIRTCQPQSPHSPLHHLNQPGGRSYHLLHIKKNGSIVIYNIVLVSGVQQSDLVTHIYVCIYTLFSILLHFSLLQDSEYSSLCYTVKHCCYLFYIWQCISVNSIFLNYLLPNSCTFTNMETEAQKGEMT